MPYRGDRAVNIRFVDAYCEIAGASTTSRKKSEKETPMSDTLRSDADAREPDVADAFLRLSKVYLASIRRLSAFIAPAPMYLNK